MNDNSKPTTLSSDEMGKLKGGFSVHPIELQNGFFASNGNCLGGGLADTNTNCTGTCSGCSVNPKPITPPGDGKPSH